MQFFGFLVTQKPLGEKKPTNQNDGFWTCINWFGIINPKESIQSQQDILQTPFRHPQDTLQTLEIYHFFAKTRPLGENELFYQKDA